MWALYLSLGSRVRSLGFRGYRLYIGFVLGYLGIVENEMELGVSGFLVAGLKTPMGCPRDPSSLIAAGLECPKWVCTINGRTSPEIAPAKS